MAIGTLYDGTRTRLTGDGPDTFTSTLDKKLRHKTMLHVRTPGRLSGTKLQTKDRLWALPETIELKESEVCIILFDLAEKIKEGSRVGLSASNEDVLIKVRNALLECLERKEYNV